MERPRTRYLEIAVPYLTAKAQNTVLNANYHAFLLRNIYLSHNTPSSGDNRSRTSKPYVSEPAPTLPPRHFIGSAYEAQRQHANFVPVPPTVRFVEGNHQAIQQNPISQQPPRRDSNLQAPQNETQSPKQRVKPQQALPQAPHSQPPYNGTLAQQQQVTQYAPPPQAPYPQLPGDGTLRHPMQLNHSPQPCMTPMEFLSTPASSISQQRFDTSQPQPQRYPTETRFGIFSDPPQSNITSAENPSTVIGSMGQQNIGVSKPQHEGNPSLDLLDRSQFSPIGGYYQNNNSVSVASNSNDRFPDIDNQEGDKGTDLMDTGH
ncbi:uncharacterized protein FSUBG_13990 [Fusarium subglutinans]|uniref:Uncharacterized protein n=1 Tax=Gibberella subglutinans TaxID=42677 RepID=A0A8H5NT16_GIBSU|nr:uncharacterized protein FSUBG_13990 [Fusarium subglutinans]KAF5574930.1 hypothetical protein FSUBG_13990 [Fusarium subglutinans]